ncbi:MAG: hypothetical protein ABFD07_06685 [Methanobacterium sp.]
MESKVCNACNTELPLDNFSKDNGTKDKLKNTCKKCCSIKNAEWRKNNKEKRKQYHKEYQHKNKEQLKEYNKKINDDFKILHGVSRHTLWDRNNKDRRKELLKIRLQNPIEALKYKLRSSLNSIFRHNGFTKKHKSHDIIGCSYEEFKQHLESLFEPWMNWDNRGLYNGEFNYGWDIDHIVPLSTATTEEELIKLCHYTNTQPLCSKVNRDIKKNKTDFSQ